MSEFLDDLQKAQKESNINKNIEINAARRVFILKPGYNWNPLRDYPRNAKCFCGSGIKFKKCCLSKQPDAVTSDELYKIKKMLEKANDNSSK